MSWLGTLYQTYQENESQVGRIQKSNYGKEVVLLPISHAYQNAQIDVAVTPMGEFYSAKVIPKEDAPTIIPVTIQSAGRTNKPSPHGLHDGLQYVAGDFEDFGGVYKRENSYQAYMKQLTNWCDSEFGHPWVKSVLIYLKRGCLIEDLVKEKVMVAQGSKLILKWSKALEEEFGEKPLLFQVLPGDQTTAFVRFSIYQPGKGSQPLWGQQPIIDSFIQYYNTQLPANGLDYVLGERLPITENHPSKIRYGGDMAKIISGNDSVNFTYRGRFTDKNQVALISYEVSQKAHNALKWLIAKQGYTIDGRVFLTWGNDQVPQVEDSSFDIFATDQEAEILVSRDTTHQQFSQLFHQALRGYKTKLAYNEPIHMMILDAATPGRMGVLYFRSLDKEVYFSRLEEWHTTCFWKHTYGSKNKQRYTFWGAPSLKDIAEATHGMNASDKMIKNTIHELFTCVVDGNNIPMYVVQNLLQRSSTPLSMENWEWQKTLSIACAVMKKHFNFKKEEQSVALDEKETNRNYLFGRLLAVADVIEERVLYKTGEKRTTNAVRYMTAFSAHPMTTWKIIQESLLPYQQRLQNDYLIKELDKITSLFIMQDYTDKALDGRYLLGYRSQREKLMKKIENTEE
ncbi:type I-C CRISPR-associated protein Cas8c/Csd1 [Enterococcus sp. DIV0876]|uniref:type I-C CRISPR-associated protein Cas8c/Csd1 n=1 Tax=Enterococcus sp. DIV0876 TaxID=2774633 RepID=UPI003D2FFE1D